MQIDLRLVQVHPFYALQNLVFMIAKHCNSEVTPSWNSYTVQETNVENLYKVNRANRQVAEVTLDSAGNAKFRFFEDNVSQGFARCVEEALPLLERKVADFITV